MPGIIIDFPTGDDWEYSLDNNTWQLSPRFLTQSDGSPFEVGQEYPIYCRNTAQGKTAMERVIFGQDDNSLESRMTLQKVIFNDPVATSTPTFEAGLIGNLPIKPAGMRTSNVVIGDDKTFYQAEIIPEVAVPNIIIFGHYIEKDPDRVRVRAPFTEWEGIITVTPRPGVYRVVGPDIFISGGTAKYSADQQLSDDSWQGYPEGYGLFSMNAIPGLSLDSTTGVLSGSVEDDMNLQIRFSVSNTTVAKNIQVKGNKLGVLQVTYAWQKNTPPVTASNLDWYVKLTKAADLQVAIEVLSPSYAALPKSAYASMNTAPSNALSKYQSLYNALATSVIKLYFREAGATTDLLVVTLPALPSTGTVPITQVYPVTT
jgi:hypothetical protein